MRLIVYDVLASLGLLNKVMAVYYSCKGCD